MIRSIEHLHAELKRMPLVESEVLHGRGVHVPLRGGDQAVAAAVAELTRDRVPEGFAYKIVIGCRILRNRGDACDTMQPVRV